MKNCTCGKQLAGNVRTCPNCGKRFTSWAVKMVMWFWIIVAVAGVIGYIVGTN